MFICRWGKFNVQSFGSFFIIEIASPLCLYNTKTLRQFSWFPSCKGMILKTYLVLRSDWPWSFDCDVIQWPHLSDFRCWDFPTLSFFQPIVTACRPTSSKEAVRQMMMTENTWFRNFHKHKDDFLNNKLPTSKYLVKNLSRNKQWCFGNKLPPIKYWVKNLSSMRRWFCDNLFSPSNYLVKNLA